VADYVPTLKLTHRGVQRMIQAAADHASAIGAPMGIVVCNASGVVLGSLLMDGAKFWALETSQKKAQTAAAMGRNTGAMPAEAEARMTAAITCFTNLRGGVPLIRQGHILGAIAAGSGTGEQDEAVAQAGAAALQD
jgi:glc operon protein GlcG